MVLIGASFLHTYSDSMTYTILNSRDIETTVLFMD